MTVEPSFVLIKSFCVVYITTQRREESESVVSVMSKLWNEGEKILKGGLNLGIGELK